MVIAGENVLDAELDEVEPARRDGAIDVHRDGPRFLPEDHLPLAARRAKIAEGLVVLAQKGAPVLGDVETAMGSVAGEVDLDCCAGLVGAGAANAHSPGPAAPAVEVHCDAPARRFGHRFRRSTVGIGGGGEDIRRGRRQFRQGERERVEHSAAGEFDAQ